jgi:hypothetical protein
MGINPIPSVSLEYVIALWADVGRFPALAERFILLGRSFQHPPQNIVSRLIRFIIHREATPSSTVSCVCGEYRGYRHLILAGQGLAALADPRHREQMIRRLFTGGKPSNCTLWSCGDAAAVYRESSSAMDSNSAT